jgi:hypothetical protein
METQIRQFNSLEKPRPPRGGIKRKFHQNIAPFRPSLFNQRPQIIMKRSGMESPPLHLECNYPSAFVDLFERHGHFTQPAPLSHRHQKTIPHPLRHLSSDELLLDVRLLFPSYRPFLLGGPLCKTKPRTRIRGHIIPPQTLLHHGTEEPDLHDRSIPSTSPPPRIGGRSRPPAHVLMSQMVGNLPGVRYLFLLEKCRQVSPCVLAALERIGIRVGIHNPGRHPMPEQSRGSTLPQKPLLDRFIGHHLMNFTERSWLSNFHPRRSLAPRSIHFFEAYPEKRRVLSVKIACHKRSVAWRSKAGQDLSAFVVKFFARSLKKHWKYFRGFESLPFRHLIINELHNRVANAVAMEARHASC